jgi:hypothetical protein
MRTRPVIFRGPCLLLAAVISAIGVYIEYVSFLPITGMSLLSVWEKMVLLCFIPQELCALLAAHLVAGFRSETLLMASAALLAFSPSLL